jgi:dTDP-4-dehydrorhamnose reductase
MKVLIIGSLGMLGSDLILAYGQNHHVIGMDVDELDITDASQCDSRLREIEPDLVINAAALTDVDYCETHEGEAFRVNGQGAGNLAAAAAAAESFMVQYSTDYVFDGDKSAAYREEDATNPTSVYGKSKLRGEEMVRSHCDDHLMLRISWLFGRQGKNFVRTIIGAAVERGALRVVHDQRGSPCFSRDIAAHTLLLTERRCRGLYHLTNSGSCTWYELALEALHWSGLDRVPVEAVKTAEFPRPAPRPANSMLANARLERENLPLLRNWQEAVREYVQELTDL